MGFFSSCAICYIITIIAEIVKLYIQFNCLIFSDIYRYIILFIYLWQVHVPYEVKILHQFNRFIVSRTWFLAEVCRQMKKASGNYHFVLKFKWVILCPSLLAKDFHSIPLSIIGSRVHRKPLGIEDELCLTY